MIYELEINGQVVKRTSNYGALKEYNTINYGGEGQIFTYRASSMNKISSVFSKEDIYDATRLRRMGKTWGEICLYLGKNLKTIKRHVRANSQDEELFKVKAGPRKFTRKDIEDIIDRRNQGQKYREIAEVYGVHNSTLSRLVNNHVLAS